MTRPGRVALFLVLVTAAAGAAAPAQELTVLATRPPDGSTGTMHYAERLEIRMGDGTPLVLESVPDQELVPIPGPRHRLDRDHYLLLGWSSTGAGMATIHAFLIELAGKALRIADTLVVNADRPSSRVVVRKEGERVSIGLFEPAAELHNRDDWSLAIGKVAHDLEAITKLRYTDFELDPTRDTLYVPPPLGEASPGARVAWVRVGRKGFKLQ